MRKLSDIFQLMPFYMGTEISCTANCLACARGLAMSASGTKRTDLGALCFPACRVVSLTALTGRPVTGEDNPENRAFTQWLVQLRDEAELTG